MDATSIQHDALAQRVGRKAAYWPWAALFYLFAAAGVWICLATPAGQFHGVRAGAFLVCLGLAFAFGSICTYIIVTRRGHAS